MLKNIRTEPYCVLAEAYLPLFDRDVEVMMDDAAHAEYAEKCISYFNSFSETLIIQLCEASIRYSDEFLDYIGQELIAYKTPRDVFNHMTPLTIIIPEPRNDGEPVVHMEFDCEWEIEHGMEWIVRGDKVLYVGSYDGNDPWGDFSSKEEWNYA